MFRLVFRALVAGVLFAEQVVPPMATDGRRIYIDARRPDVLEVIRLRFKGTHVAGSIDRHRRAFDRCGAVTHTRDVLRGTLYGGAIRFSSPRGDSAVFQGDRLRVSEPGARGTHVFSLTSEGAVPGLVLRFAQRQAALSKSAHYPNARIEALRGKCR